jgi:hypothetical protein
VVDVIDFAIQQYHHELQVNIDPITGIPLSLPPLAYTLNDREIAMARKDVGDRHDICFVKGDYLGHIRIFYVNHPLGEFTVGLNKWGSVVSVS